MEIIRYVTEGSFDVFMWQTVERKAGFIHQVTRGDIAGREIDDVGDQALSYSQVKALATGNPLIMERAGVEQEMAKLERLAHAHRREQHDLEGRQQAAEAHAARLDALAGVCEEAARRRVDTRADRFAMMVDERTYTSRVDAGVALRNALLATLDHRPPGSWDRRVDTVGELGGFRVAVERVRYGLDDRGASELIVLRHGSPDTGGSGERATPIEALPLRRLPLERADVAHADPTGLVAKLEGRIARLDETASGYRAQAETSRAEATAISGRLGRPFEHHDRLRHLRHRLTEIDEALTPTDPERPQAEPQRTDPLPGPVSPAAAEAVSGPPHSESAPLASPGPSVTTDPSLSGAPNDARHGKAKPARRAHNRRGTDLAAAPFGGDRPPVQARDGTHDPPAAQPLRAAERGRSTARPGHRHLTATPTTELQQEGLMTTASTHATTPVSSPSSPQRPPTEPEARADSVPID